MASKPAGRVELTTFSAMSQSWNGLLCLISLSFLLLLSFENGPHHITLIVLFCLILIPKVSVKLCYTLRNPGSKDGVRLKSYTIIQVFTVLLNSSFTLDPLQVGLNLHHRQDQESPNKFLTHSAITEGR